MTYDKTLRRAANNYPRISDLAKKAKKRMPNVAWEYLDSGTGNEQLLAQNTRAFQSLRFYPRFCKGELNAEATTTLFGKSFAAPIGIAPVGLTGLMWPKTELYLAATAHRMNIPYCLSTVATETPEIIGKEVGGNGWFQLYPPKDREVRDSLLKRASDAGFHTLVITADVPMASRRERSKKAGLAIPPKITPKLIWDGMKHPLWGWQTLKRGLPRLRTVEHYTNTTDMKFTSGFVGNRLGGTLDWQYCAEVKATWNGPVVLKGILHPEDAKKAMEIGLDGIYVSNHGARQFNGAVTAIEALPEIVKVIKGKIPILFDSGIRSGLDIMKALYLGADFVFAGRPFIYGVAALGKYGGDYTANLLIDDLKNNMVQLGSKNLSKLREATMIMI
ncbi:alpha-hydroxy acid oxidase [Croceivirga thetidis]|uniref:Alpha-hydroxy-acid oxidizing protein n=1 Tax=Croceivirga thetidis TaxID=2721623 RepID=A0ABX1GQT5_9FLAO|nr:alpha-hydroxy acid oxidase [Croceivirga thetidis]NKI32288.1 alpha-hydroxy-acid oxidizing protein [Croceivirga thetidis]